MQANETELENHLRIGEEILLISSFILLCEPLLRLVRYRIKRNPPFNPKSRDPLHHALILLKLAVTVALILGICLANLSSVGEEAGKLSTLQTCRDVNANICLVITIACALVTLLAQATDNSPPRKGTLILVAASTILSIASRFKIYIYVKTSNPSLDSARGKVAFYFLSDLPNSSPPLCLTVNFTELFDVEEGWMRDKIEQAMITGTYIGDGWSGKEQQGYRGQHELNRA